MDIGIFSEHHLQLLVSSVMILEEFSLSKSYSTWEIANASYYSHFAKVGKSQCWSNEARGDDSSEEVET
jgi:hypothetical protein